MIPRLQFRIMKEKYLLFYIIYLTNDTQHHVPINDIKYTFTCLCIQRENITMLQNLQRNHYLITAVENAKDVNSIEHEKCIILRKYQHRYM